MVTNAEYAALFGVPLVLCALVAVAASGGDLAFVPIAVGVSTVTVLIVAVVTLSLVRWLNHWQAAPLGALAHRLGGRVEQTIGGDRCVVLDDGAPRVVFYRRTPDDHDPEELGTPWTCVGLRRDGEGGVEVRMAPGVAPQVRWSKRLLPRRGDPPDPLRTEAQREAAAALAAIRPREETRLFYARGMVAFGVMGTVHDPDALVALTRQAERRLPAL